MEALVYLGSTEESWVLPDYNWLGEWAGSHCCDRCGALRAEWHGRGLDVRVSQLLPTHTVACFGHLRGWLAVCRREIHDLLVPHIDHYACGQVVHSSSDIGSRYVSVNLAGRVLRRGDAGRSTYSYCDTCGALKSSRLVPPFHFTEGDLQGRAVVQDGAGILYVDKHVAAGLGLLEMEGLVWAETQVRAEERER